LHAGLLEAATAAGVRLEHGDVGPVSQDALSVHCSGFRARYLAAADGLHSPIRAALGLARASGGPRRWGIRRHILMTPWSDCVEVYWSDDTEAYVTPVADDCVGIAILTSRKGGFDEHLGGFPALQEVVHGKAHGADRAAGPLRQKVRSRTAGRVMLVGDAAGYVDALTGEGLGIAFGAAELLVESVTADRPEDYDRRWRRMSRRYRLLTAAVLQASAMRPLRSRIVPAAAQFPGVFRGVVNLLAE
jgi:flavin-dependent dehydrogenase